MSERPPLPPRPVCIVPGCDNLRVDATLTNWCSDHIDNPPPRPARETPEPLTPREARDAMLRTLQEERVYGPRRQRIEDAADRMVNAAVRAIRAVTPDPAEHGHTREVCEHPETQALRDLLALRAATPDPAEPGREALEAVERDLRIAYGDVSDVWEPWARIRAALRAATPDPAESGLDVERRLADALDSEAVANVIGPLESGEVTLVSRILAAALSDTTEGQS